MGHQVQKLPGAKTALTTQWPHTSRQPHGSPRVRRVQFFGSARFNTHQSGEPRLHLRAALKKFPVDRF